MKLCILSIALLSSTLISTATDFKFADIPQKDGAPYYEWTIPAQNRNTAEKNEHFHKVQLFLAGYFKKTMPEIKIEDKEDGVMAVRVTLSYNFLDNPTIYHGKSRCLLNIKIAGDGYRVTLYDFELYRQATQSTLNATPYGIAPKGQTVWNRENEREVYKKAAGAQQNAVAEMKAMNERVAMLKEALAKKLAD